MRLPQVTVLAPSNAAFAAWVTGLDALPAGALKAVLQYHVVQGQ
jgi:uncharacterized surface protein with fasciclin (FAS1) repeats